MSRVLLFSDRNAVEWRKWHAYLYEFEDLILDVEDVELVAPPLAPDPLRARAVARARHRLAGGPPPVPPRVAPTEVRGEHDLFFAFCGSAEDIRHLGRLEGLAERCRTKVCFIAELFTHRVERMAHHLDTLRQLGFDRVLLFNPRPSAAVGALAGCPASFMALGADALLFSPLPHLPPRCVDLFHYGRRWEATHRAALDMADRDGRFYIHDTVDNVPLPDYRAHRRMIAETLKRTRFVVSYKAAEDVARMPQDDPVSSRYFEGIAGGAVLIGTVPQVPEFTECFPWPDATIPIPLEAHDLRDIVADLEAQPDRLAAARTANVLAALRRHDWAYRWSHVLELAGLTPTPAHAARLERLAEMADAVEQRGLDGAGGAQPPRTTRSTPS